MPLIIERAMRIDLESEQMIRLLDNLLKDLFPDLVIIHLVVYHPDNLPNIISNLNIHDIPRKVIVDIFENV